MSWVHVLNPNAAHRPLVTDYFSSRPHAEIVTVDRDSHPEHVETIVEWALMENRDRLAVWAGDGTFSRIVHRLYELKALDRVTLALIPAGTCNDFVRFQEAGDWRAVAAAVEGGHFTERRIDVGVVEHERGRRAFFNNAGFGREPSATAKHRSNPIRDILAFSAKSLGVVWRAGGKSDQARFDAYLGIVFNAPYFNGGMHFEKNSDPADGRLDAYFAPAAGKLALMAQLLGAKFGRALLRPSTIRLGGEEIIVSSDRDLYPQADGERASDGPVRSLTFRCLPGALRLAWPQAR